MFPGVVAISDCMGEIMRLKCEDSLNEVIFNLRLPVLAICVGMQALMTHSEENAGVDCLNIIQGKVKRFPNKLMKVDSEILKVPHMGWNYVNFSSTSKLGVGFEENSRFYFVHSYYCNNTKSSYCHGFTDYGGKFTSVIENENFFGVQFHPEKSLNFGIQLFKNFLKC